MLISVGVSILLAACVAVVGRSLAFGVSAAIGWFAADNIGVLVMILVFRFTQNEFWEQITGYFLGPILNTMPAAVVPGLPISVTAPNGAVINSHVSRAGDRLPAAGELRWHARHRPDAGLRGGLPRHRGGPHLAARRERVGQRDETRLAPLP